MKLINKKQWNRDWDGFRKLLFFSVLLLFSGCNFSTQEISFKGELTNCTQQKITLYQLFPDYEEKIMEADIKNGKFTLKHKGITEKQSEQFPSFYKIVISEMNYIVTLASPGDKIVFQGDASNWVKTYQVAGPKDPLLMWELDHQLKLFIDSVEALQTIYEEHRYSDSVKMEIEKTYNQYILNHQNFLLCLIQNNSTSLATLIAFYQRFNRRIFIEEKEHLPLLQSMYDTLNAHYPNNPNLIYLKERLEDISE